jgi:hypothetical protein
LFPFNVGIQWQQNAHMWPFYLSAIGPGAGSAAHRLSISGRVGVETFGKMTKFVGGTVDPFVGVGATNESGMFECFPSGGIDDGVRTVEGNISGSDLGGKADRVVSGDNTLLTGMMLDMVCFLSGNAPIGHVASGKVG